MADLCIDAVEARCSNFGRGEMGMFAFEASSLIVDVRLP